MPAKLRSRRRKAAKCKSLGLNAQTLSVCVKKAEFIKNALLAKNPNNADTTAPATPEIKKNKPKNVAAKTVDRSAEKIKPVKTAEPTAAIKNNDESASESKPAVAKKQKAAKPAEQKATKADKAATETTVTATEKVELAKEVEPAKTAEPVEESTSAAEVKTDAATEIVAAPAADSEAKPETVTVSNAAKKTAETAKDEPAETAAEENTEAPAENSSEISDKKAPAKDGEKTKLDPTENADLLGKIATKRARKLIYAPKEAIYEVTGIKIDVEGKKNDKGVKIKDILEAEIKEGLKLGYLDKYDGLKTSEIKEEYENDTVWEIAEQEFKKMGLLLDGDKIKVYVFDWTGTGCHHVGYIPDDKAPALIHYLADMDKYSFDLDGIITGGKSKTVTKDPKTGKITITKGKDGGYGIDLDVTIINRKD